jgi:hypothetical protein
MATPAVAADTTVRPVRYAEVRVLPEWPEQTLSAARNAELVWVPDILGSLRSDAPTLRALMYVYQTVYAPPIDISPFTWALSNQPPLRDARLNDFYDRLAELAAGKWDPSRGEAPDAVALRFAEVILDSLVGGNLVPRKLVAADGQISLYFVAGDKYATVEIINGGELLSLLSDGHDVPTVSIFTLDQLSATIDKIGAYLA